MYSQDGKDLVAVWDDFSFRSLSPSIKKRLAYKTDRVLTPQSSFYDWMVECVPREYNNPLLELFFDDPSFPKKSGSSEEIIEYAGRRHSYHGVSLIGRMFSTYEHDIKCDGTCRSCQLELKLAEEWKKNRHETSMRFLKDDI